MIKNILISFTFLLLGNNILIAQNYDWTEPPYDFLEGKVSKLDDNIRYTMDAIISIEERSMAINTIKQYIAQNLSLLRETDFKDSVHIVLAKDRAEMSRYTGGPILGVYMSKDQHVPENMMFCIYGTQYDALKHELMHMLSISKWGGIETNNGRAAWLEEGLAVFANPEAENCDGYTLEERYIYFLENDKLLKFDSLFITVNTIPDLKISYTQAGYLVSYLVNNFGIEKLKTLWLSDVNDFEKIYGIRFEDILLEMHNNLRLKYPLSINIDNEYLYKNCVE